MTFNFVEF